MRRCRNPGSGTRLEVLKISVGRRGPAVVENIDSLGHTAPTTVVRSDTKHHVIRVAGKVTVVWVFIRIGSASIVRTCGHQFCGNSEPKGIQRILRKLPRVLNDVAYTRVGQVFKLSRLRFHTDLTPCKVGFRGITYAYGLRRLVPTPFICGNPEVKCFKSLESILKRRITGNTIVAMSPFAIGPRPAHDFIVGSALRNS